MQVYLFLEEKYNCLRISIGGGDNMKKALIFLFDGFAEFGSEYSEFIFDK